MAMKSAATSKHHSSAKLNARITCTSTSKGAALAPRKFRRYLGIVAGGFEDIAQAEILRVLGVKCTVVGVGKDIPFGWSRGSCGLGKLVFASDASFDTISRLRFVQCVFAFIAETRVEFQDSMNAIDSLKLIDKQMRSVGFEPWNDALALWESWCLGIFPDQDRGQGQDLQQRICTSRRTTFRASTCRNGKHKFKSVDCSGYMGRAVQDLFGWVVDLKNFEVEVVAFLLQNDLVLCLSLPDRDTIGNEGYLNHPRINSGSLSSEPRHLFSPNCLSKRIASLRPSTAYMMLLLADIRPHDIVLDCCAGVGTIPIEASTQWQSVGYSAEYDEDAVAACQENVLHAIKRVKESRITGALQCTRYEQARCPVGETIRWDCRHMAFRSGTIDKVVTDLPFGIKCGLQLFQFAHFCRELARILVPGTGRAVILGQQFKKVKAVLEDSKDSFKPGDVWTGASIYFSVEKCLPVNIGGLTNCFLWVLKRTKYSWKAVLDARRKEDYTQMILRKKVIGKMYKRESVLVMQALSDLTEAEAHMLNVELDEKQAVELSCGPKRDKLMTITRDMVQWKVTWRWVNTKPS